MKLLINKRLLAGGLICLFFWLGLKHSSLCFAEVKSSGTIITVDEKNRKIYLNIGKKDGVKVGDHLTSYREINPYMTTLIVLELIDDHLSVALLPRASEFVPQEGDSLIPSEEADNCMICHLSFEKQYQAEPLHEPALAVKCRNCHGSHQPKADEAKIPNKVNCDSCHQIKLEGTPSHQKFYTPGCRGCHNIHSKDSTNAESEEFCVGCHKLEKEETLSAHFNFLPTKGKCYSCHDPHNKREGKYLYSEKHSPFDEEECDSCHSQESEPGAAVTLSADHVSNLCYECHDEFTESVANTHMPVFSGDCTSCHSPHLSSREFYLKSNKSSLCLKCHSAKFSDADKHKPVVEGDCLTCHMPHQSTEKKLLREPLGQLCVKCHAQSSRTSLFVHNPYAEKNCSACHLSHSTNKKYQLKDDPTKTCMSCHDNLAETSKPRHNKMFNKSVPPGFPRNGYKLRLTNEKLITCYTCHDPHNSTNRKFLREEPDFLCNLCHANHWLKVFAKEKKH